MLIAQVGVMFLKFFKLLNGIDINWPHGVHLALKIDNDFLNELPVRTYVTGNLRLSLSIIRCCNRFINLSRALNIIFTLCLIITTHLLALILLSTFLHTTQ